MERDSMAKLVLQTKERRRLKTDLSAFDTYLKEMLDLNISLPVMMEWLLKEKQTTTTLPALRRYVRRVFGDDFYQAFLIRNGWQKRPREASSIRKLTLTAETESKLTEPVAQASKKAKPNIEAKQNKKLSEVDALKAVIHSNLDTSQYD